MLYDFRDYYSAYRLKTRLKYIERFSEWHFQMIKFAEIGQFRAKLDYYSNQEILRSATTLPNKSTVLSFEHTNTYWNNICLTVAGSIKTIMSVGSLNITF